MAEYSFKLVLLGNGGTGKTSLVRKYVRNIFEEKYVNTLGVQNSVKRITQGDTRAVLTIWDVSGQAKFASFARLYLSGTNFFLLVFDVLDEKSITDLPTWVKHISDVVFKSSLKPTIPYLGIIGNKADLTPQYNVNEAVLAFLRYYWDDVLFVYETSAKTGKNIELMFKNIAAHLLNGKKQFRQKDVANFKPPKPLA